MIRKMYRNLVMQYKYILKKAILFLKKSAARTAF